APRSEGGLPPRRNLVASGVRPWILDERLALGFARELCDSPRCRVRCGTNHNRLWSAQRTLPFPRKAGPGSPYGAFFPFVSASSISFSTALSIAFSPGAPTHLWRIPPLGSST